MTAGNIQSRLEVTGVYLLERTKFCHQNTVEESVDCEDLPYIPMLTPSCPSDSSNVDLNDTSGLDLNDFCNTASMDLQANYVYEFIEQMETKQRKKALTAHTTKERKYLRELKKQYSR